MLVSTKLIKGNLLQVLEFFLLVDFFVLILFERLHTFHSILLRWNDENNKAEMPKFNETSWKLVSCK